MVKLNHPRFEGVQIDRPSGEVARHEAAGWVRAGKRAPAGRTGLPAADAGEKPDGEGDAGDKSPEPKPGGKPGK